LPGNEGCNCQVQDLTYRGLWRWLTEYGVLRGGINGGGIRVIHSLYVQKKSGVCDVLDSLLLGQNACQNNLRKERFILLMVSEGSAHVPGQNITVVEEGSGGCSSPYSGQETESEWKGPGTREPQGPTPIYFLNLGVTS
jgi:hypothetical protein